jgi:hypothetical protein
MRLDKKYTYQEIGKSLEQHGNKLAIFGRKVVEDT